MTNFMTTLFYFMTFFFILYEYAWIGDPTKHTQYMKDFEEGSEDRKGKTWLQYTESQKEASVNFLYQAFYIFWMFAGILSHQWFIFSCWLLFNIVIIHLLSKIWKKYSSGYIILHWFNSWLCLFTLFFILLNHFHFHIDIGAWFLNYIHKSLLGW